MFPEAVSAWQSTQRDAPRPHYWHLARRHLIAERADLPHPRGVFFLRTRRRSSPVVNPERNPDGLPGLRHHAARRRAARGHQLLGRRQARGGPAARRVRRRLHRGRLAGRDAQGHRVLPPGAHRAGPQARACSSRSARPARPASPSPTTRRCARCSTPRRRPSAWSPSPTSGTSSAPCAPPATENLAMVRDTVAHFVAEGRRVFLDCEHFFDGFRYDPDVHRERRRARRWTPAPSGSSCATPTAACFRRGSPRRSAT